MYGKIARLGREIREELNLRLDDNVVAEPLLAWLNGLPEVRSVLKEQFGGIPISKQNLSEWRMGGFKRWQAQRELLEQARDMAADATELTSATDGRLTDHLATVLSARYAVILSGWNSEVSEESRQQLRSLHGLCRDVVALRRGDFHCTRLRLEQERTELEREKTEEEMVEHFQEWLKNPEVRALVAELLPEGQRSKVQNSKSKVQGREGVNKIQVSRERKRRFQGHGVGPSRTGMRAGRRSTARTE